MLKLEYSTKFKKDYKLAVKRGLDTKKLAEVIGMLSRGEVLPSSYRDHLLVESRNYTGMRECHIQPDWLLIYRIENDILTLRLIRTGTHSDLF